MTMLTLSKWGNAQAVRLPKAMREQVGMPDDSQIEATVENGAIVLKPDSCRESCFGFQGSQGALPGLRR